MRSIAGGLAGSGGASGGGGVEAQPFLKWVGGKAQLLAQFAPHFPPRIERYVEPFIGGGAVFFHLKHRFPAMRALLRDSNPELINSYRAVRDEPVELMKRLDEHLAQYDRRGKDYYYEVRAQHELPAADGAARAARMIFLNKTCYNGLWRVNARGEFNVPHGRRARTTLYNRTNLLAASAALQGVELAAQHFRATLAEAQRGDFMYIDPPYVPVSATAHFTSYTREDFSLDDQQELAGLAAQAMRGGVRLMLSNSDTPLVRTLYRGFDLHRVQARRAVNRVATKRGVVSEIVACAGA
jgi:DNA adenine methylase